MQEAELAQVYTAAGRTPEVDRALSNLFGVIRMFGAMANSPTCRIDVSFEMPLRSSAVPTVA